MQLPFKTMFRDAIRGVVDKVDGGLAGMLIDFEGIPLESYARGASPLDMEAIGAEVSVLVKSIQRAGEMLEAGATHEVSIRNEHMVTVIRVLNETYFMAVTLAPEGNLGKARYLMRVAAPRLVEELG